MATTMDFIPPTTDHLRAPRKRVACDECRTRKLKCSGERDGCSRCKAERIDCEYSYQKQMGRPRKRRHDEPEEIQNTFDAGDISLDCGTAEGTFLQELNLHQSNSLPVDLPGLEQSQNDFIWTPSNDLGDFSQVNYASLDNPKDQDLNRGSTEIFGESFEIQGTLPNLRDRHAITISNEVVPQSASTNHNSSSSPSCECLSKLYRTLTAFQTLPTPSFPRSLSILTQATTLSRTVLRCDECRKTYVAAVQNLMLLCTLLTLVANEYARLLVHVCDRVCRTAEGKITMRVGERAEGEEHLHTNELDCPMGFDVAMTGAEWGDMARKAIRNEILGLEGREGESLLGLVDEMEQRQKMWHTMPSREDQARCQQCEQSEGDKQVGDGERPICLALVNSLRRSINELGL